MDAVFFDSLSLSLSLSVLEAVVSPLDDGNGARVAENCVHKLPTIRPTCRRYLPPDILLAKFYPELA